MFRHALVALLLFCVVAPLQAAEPLRLGLNYPSTGNYKSEGLELRRGALLAIDQINSQVACSAATAADQS